MRGCRGGAGQLAVDVQLQRGTDFLSHDMMPESGHEGARREDVVAALQAGGPTGEEAYLARLMERAATTGGQRQIREVLLRRTFSPCDQGNECGLCGQPGSWQLRLNPHLQGVSLGVGPGPFAVHKERLLGVAGRKE